MTATARLDLRLSTKDRERIDRAAALAGLPLAAFVRSAVFCVRRIERLRPNLWRPYRSPSQSDF